MTDLRVYFGGICTHILAPYAPPGVLHRVVLVNGVEQSTINGHLIAPHLATLQLSEKDLLATSNLRLPPAIDGKIMWQIGGAALQIANASPTGISYLPTYRTCIPSLKRLTPDSGALSPMTVDAKDQLLASCYFDVNNGVFDAGKDASNAAVAMLQCEVDGDAPVIAAESFVWGSGTLTLRPGSSIYVTNFGTGPGLDDLYDFLLHYRVLETIPPDAGVPTSTIGCPSIGLSLVPKTLDVGPGCSNSNYP